MQSFTEAEEANLELSGAQRLSWAAFGRSRALESTATGTMLSARRSRFFASASRRARPVLRREERRRTTVAFSAQPSNPARTHTFPFGKRVEKLSTKMQALREAEEANLELSGAQRLSWAAFGRSLALESNATGTMLSARRSRFFSASRRARPLLRREERRRTTVAFSAQPSNPARTGGKAFDEDAGAQRSRRGQSGAVRSSAPVVGGFRQEPRFGEHCYRHNAQCAKKPLLRLRQPESAAAVET
ncbi:unnamed protein product [Coccothraustes coccothraustes]